MIHLIRKAIGITSGAALALAMYVMPVAAAPAYSLFGDAEVVQPGNASPNGVQLRSDADPGYGGIDFEVAAGTTFADLDTLSTDYMFTAGSCGGGAPRFQVNLDSNNDGDADGNAFVYIGPPPGYTGCPPNVWQTTGNLADPTDFVDTSQLGGTFYDTFATAQVAYGSYAIVGIQLVTDAGWLFGEQTVVVDNVVINNDLYTFENANSCKKGGWQQFTTEPGPFKNQGQCVSHFAKNK